MPQTKPFDDVELAGLVMAVTAEAQRAGWQARYGIQGDGSLVIHLHHARKEFSMVTADDGSRGRLVIVDYTYPGLSTDSPLPEGKGKNVTAGGENES